MRTRVFLFTLALLSGAWVASTGVAQDSPGKLVAAGGLVEPAGEERVVIPQLSGRLSRVYVAEGDTVKRGQLLAEIENAEYRAQLAAAEADLRLRLAEQQRLKQGARPEERREARALVAEALAVERLASAELERRRPLAAKQQLSRAGLEEAEAAQAQAAARHELAAARLALIENGARREDLDAAAARTDAAQAQRDYAAAQLEKSLIRSPLDGVVLKRDLSEGETVVALSPVPLARLGDLSRRFVRADIDELDIARVRVGQSASISSDAFPGLKAQGKVVRVSQRMGRRNLISDDPAEKMDSKILEALIEINDPAPLPIGLRVDVLIRTD